MKFIYNLLVLILLFTSCSQKEEKVCVINGTVTDSEIKSILLVKPNQDMRFDSLIELPVVDGNFNFKKRLDFPESTNLFLGKAKDMGGGRFMPFFLENDSINLTIYPENDFDKNIVKGGSLNAKFKKFRQGFDLKFEERQKILRDSISTLYKNNEYNSEEMNSLYEGLRAAKNHDEKIIIYEKMDSLRDLGLDLSSKGKILNNKQKVLIEEQNKFKQKYIDKNPNIISYSFLIQDLVYNKEQVDVNLAKHNYETLVKGNPDHPYNDLVSNLINAIENIKVGKKYVDFSAPDLNGNIIKLSDKIDGEVTLLDLWATWCGPCISKSRTMVPVYNDYKDKGFTIVGVAGEFKNTDRLTRFLEKEKWPWLNLVELDREHKIWQKYNVDGGGGGIFLIDKNGKILAKDPTAEEVRKTLESLLL